MKNKRFRIKVIMLAAVAAVVCLMLTGCDTPIKVEESGGLSYGGYYIVVDEDSLVQYVKSSYGITVRLKADGTPYTIAPEDLNKYQHFSFSESADS